MPPSREARDQGGKVMGDSFLVEALRNMKLRYPVGEITDYFPDKGYGFIRSERGEKIFFFLPEVDTIGFRIQDVRLGLRVGYDVSVTAKGRRVSRMRGLVALQAGQEAPP
jgi:cold shock CspA family protein